MIMICMIVCSENSSSEKELPFFH